jgi:hypothetical protein
MTNLDSALAGDIGLKRCWYRRGHYDLHADFHARALRAGAVLVKTRECARARRHLVRSNATN